MKSKMTKCVACGKELDESGQTYYRKDDSSEDDPCCESCASISAKNVEPKQKRSETNPGIEDLQSKKQMERLQAKMFVLGLLNIVSGLGQLFLSLLIPLLVISALIEIGIGLFLIFY